MRLTTNCVTKLRDSESYTLSTVITLIFPISLNTTTTTLCDTTKRRIHHLMGFPIVRRYENDKPNCYCRRYIFSCLSLLPHPNPRRYPSAVVEKPRMSNYRIYCFKKSRTTPFMCVQNRRHRIWMLEVVFLSW